jgi:nucleotide-binding universal stress UspA family protein
VSRIVVGYDGRDPARDALALAMQFADVSGNRVLLVAVFPYTQRLIGGLGYEQLLAADAKRVFEPIEEEFGTRVETRAIGGHSPARVLHDVAEAETASMLVVGSSERGPIGRVVPGSVGERLLHGAPCPVAVAPRGFADRERRSLQHFAVAFDGSRQSWAALAFAGDLAGPAHAHVDLVGVLVPWSPPGPAAFRYAELSEMVDLDEVDRERRADLEKRLDNALGELPEPVRGHAVLLSGDAADELSIWAAREQIDLLLCGSRGYGPLHRVLTGGVSAALARQAPTALVVVPRADR